MQETERRERREDLFSKAVRAGKRTYFFDVKATRTNQQYLTITESKKKFSEDHETFYYEKHKIFLYGEDFDKFKEGLQDAISFIEKGAEADNDPLDINVDEVKISDETDVSFEDLGNDNSKI